MQNLRDKLLKAGVVDKKTKKKADHAERKRRTKARRSGKAKGTADEERQAQFERQRAEQREQDRLREQQRETERRAEAERAARERAEAQAAEREAQARLQAVARVRDLVQASMFLPKAPGPVRFNFVSRTGGIRHLDLSTRVVHELDRGQLAIAQLPGRERWGLIRRDVAEQVIEVDPALVRFFAPDGGEPLTPPVVEEGAPKAGPSGKGRALFSTGSEPGGGRRDR